MKFKNKEIRVILSEEATQEYGQLKNNSSEEMQQGIASSVHQSIFRSVERVYGWLKENPFAGDQVQKSKIPSLYLKKYGITNLWRIELSNYWRLVYTLQSSEFEIHIFVLNIVGHETYDKIFGYKGI